MGLLLLLLLLSLLLLLIVARADLQWLVWFGEKFQWMIA